MSAPASASASASAPGISPGESYFLQFLHPVVEEADGTLACEKAGVASDEVLKIEGKPGLRELVHQVNDFMRAPQRKGTAPFNGYDSLGKMFRGSDARSKSNISEVKGDCANGKIFLHAKLKRFVYGGDHVRGMGLLITFSRRFGDGEDGDESTSPSSASPIRFDERLSEGATRRCASCTGASPSCGTFRWASSWLQRP